jgi:hypothetical protein
VSALCGKEMQSEVNMLSESWFERIPGSKKDILTREQVGASSWNRTAGCASRFCPLDRQHTTTYIVSIMRMKYFETHSEAVSLFLRNLFFDAEYFTKGSHLGVVASVISARAQNAERECISSRGISVATNNRTPEMMKDSERTLTC